MNNVNTRRIAFFDAEFTADTAKDRGIQEMIQCALVVHEIQITDERFLISMTEEPIHTYNTFVKPRYTKRLSKYIRDLTGIKQSDVNGGKDFDDVISDICDIINNYFIDDILTWGPDKTMLRYNCSVLSCDKQKVRMICNKINDVSQRFSDFLGYGTALSQHKACQMLHIKEFGEMHNAYCDAVNLSQIIRKFCGQTMP
jgi:inhibitor of KinA sporulation pathway (predicted exonuclease)